jgi:hypothetical protein
MKATPKTSKTAHPNYRRPFRRRRDKQPSAVEVRPILLLSPPMPVPTAHTPVQRGETYVDSFRLEFSHLAEQWRRDTHHLSNISKKILHPAYLRIMGMGERVVPLLLAELRARPDHWFVALRAITNIDPVQPGSNPRMAREAWLAWGRNQGLV